MATNLDFVEYRMRLRLRGTVNLTGATDVIVNWTQVDGGTLDAVTGAMVGGVQTPVSGVIRALGMEEPARTVLRQYAEIQAGDVILEVNPHGMVEMLPNQPVSGVVSLDDVSGQGVRFEWGGRLYAQAEIGEDLAQAWSVIIENRKLYRTLLLRRAT
jgi:hypothetical protein